MTNLIAAAIAEAEVITASAPPDASQNKPRLLVESSDPDRTVAALRNILADAGMLFDRGVPVRLTFDQIQGGAAAQIMSPDGLVLMAHNVCRPSNSLSFSPMNTTAASRAACALASSVPVLSG